MKKCLFCGKGPVAIKYCSTLCKSRYRSKHVRYDKVCEFCEKEFDTTTKATRFCSTSCAGKGTPVPLKTLICVDCGEEFEFKGRTKKLRCGTCWSAKRSEQSMTYRCQKDASIKRGAGSGGAQFAEANHMWNSTAKYHRHDGYHYDYRARCFKHWIKACVVCDKEEGLIDVHHVNGDREDVSFGNLVPLCRKCHSQVHKINKELGYDKYEEALFDHLWKEGRSKIAELSGNPTSDDKGIRTEG